MPRWKPGPPKGGRTYLNGSSAGGYNLSSKRRRMWHDRAIADDHRPPSLSRQTDHCRGHRRLRKEHAVAALTQVAGIKGTQGLFHRVELLRTGEGHDQAWEEEQEPHTNYV